MRLSGRLYSLGALPHGDSPWYPLDRKVGELEGRYEHFGEQKNYLSLLGIELRLLGGTAHGVVAISTELSRFLLDLLILVVCDQEYKLRK
jgi:hypothetical protein